MRTPVRNSTPCRGRGGGGAGPIWRRLDAQRTRALSPLKYRPPGNRRSIHPDELTSRPVQLRSTTIVDPSAVSLRNAPTHTATAAYATARAAAAMTEVCLNRDTSPLV